MHSYEISSSVLAPWLQRVLLPLEGHSTGAGFALIAVYERVGPVIKQFLLARRKQFHLRHQVVSWPTVGWNHTYAKATHKKYSH